jgi:hypothetical protein
VRVAWVVVVSACGRVGFEPHAQDASNVDASAPTACADPKLAACYEFEGNTLDGTPNHNDATPMATSFGAGVVGMALLVDASSNVHVDESASLDLTTAVTVEAWIRLDAPPTTGQRAVFVDHNSGYALFATAAGAFACGTFDTGGNNNLLTGPVFPMGAWHHAAFTFDGAALALYLDGAQVATHTTSGDPIQVPADQMQLGGNAPDGSDPTPARMIGAIDEVRIWSVARTQAELCAATGTC